MKKFIFLLLMVVASFALATTGAFAGEDDEGTSESGSGFSDDGGDDSGSDDSGSDDSGSDDSGSDDGGSDDGGDDSGSDDGGSDPSPGPSGSDDGGSDPSPGPSGSDDSSDDGDDDTGSDGGGSDWVSGWIPGDIQPAVVPVPASIEVTPAPDPDPEPEPTPAVTKNAAVKKTAAKPQVVETVITPYEPPYVTVAKVADCGDVLRQLVDKKEDTAAEEEEEDATASSNLVILPILIGGLLALIAILLRPYKIVRINKDGKELEVARYFGIKGAAAEAAKLLVSKDFRENNNSLKILKIGDDKNKKAEKIDRLVYLGLTDGSVRKTVKATEREEKACKKANLLECLLLDEAEQWLQLAMA